MKFSDLLSSEAWKPRRRGADGTPVNPAAPARPSAPVVAAPAAAPAARAGVAAAASAVSAQRLAERREELAGQFAAQQWDLGGLVYEMATRDFFRLDVVIRHAAKLQQIDAQLADIDRLIRLDQAGAEGSCPSCGALYARGAAFCWQCGHSLMATVDHSATAANGSTAGDPAKPAALPAPTPEGGA